MRERRERGERPAKIDTARHASAASDRDVSPERWFSNAFRINGPEKELAAKQE